MSMQELQKQTDANISAKADLIWQIATHLVGLFKPHEYGKVILPMTVLKRFDDALRKTKPAVVEMAKDDIKVGAKICDPACGVGKFLLEPVLTKLDQFYEIKKGKLTPKITINGFDKGFDKDEQKTIILAKANMLIYFSDLIKENPTITTEFAQLFNDSFLLKTNSILSLFKYLYN